MLLKIFKRTGPGAISLIILTLLVVWASAFINLGSRFSLYFDLDPMPLYGLISSLIGTNPLPGIFFSLLLLSSMAFLMVDLNTKLVFINERTFLPALIYILLSGLFTQYQLMNPAVIAAMFLMLAFRRIMEAYRVNGTAYNFFDAGILIGTGSLFYANLIWFGLLIIIGIAILRTGNPKEIAISFVGLVTPYILTFEIYYVLGKDLKELAAIIEYNLRGKTSFYAFTPLTVTAILFAGLIAMISIFYLMNVMGSKKISSRKTFLLLLWLFFISSGMYFSLPSVSVEVIWLIGIPVSYFLAHYFVVVRKKLIPEILFSILFILILLIQILHLSKMILF
jgi:hypothetical protein